MPPRLRDYLDGTSDRRFAEYLLRARERFLAGESATVAQVKAVYRRAAELVRREIERMPGPLQRVHMEELHRRLEIRAAELREELLRATERGIRLSIQTATDAGRQITLDLLRGLFDAGGVEALFADVNERALLAVMSRTRHDGLRLSDRIWRIGQRWREATARVIEDAVLRGEDPRKTAKRVEAYLQPGVWTALKEETRQRLRVPRDVSMEGLRLAVTEYHHAHHEATVLTGRAIPSYRGIYWRLSNAHVVPDVCDDLANHGGNGFWPAGHEPPKPHPWCRCYTVLALEDTDQFVERLRQWVADPMSQPDLEAWYLETGRRFLRRPGQVRGTFLVTPPKPATLPAGVPALVQELLTTGRQATPEELQAIREHVAQVGFPPGAKTKAGGRVAGLKWRGTTITSSTRLPADVYHYLVHVVTQQEWPEGTTLEEYLAGIWQVVLDPSTGVALTDFHGVPQVTFLRRSLDLRGPEGHDWVLVEYRPAIDRVVTAYQPRPDRLQEILGRVVRWLVEPR